MLDINGLAGYGVIAGLAIIGILVFSETAVLAGLFVPGGDILLLLSGVFAAEGDLPLAGVLIIVFIAAVAGYETGYYVGAKTGPRIFTSDKGLFFRKEYAKRATDFYERHGAKTIVIARFIAYVRTVAPLMAGIGKMHRRKFVMYNIIGSLLWTVILVMLGFWLGSAFADEIKHYSMLITVFGMALVIVVVIFSAFANRSRNK